MQACSHAPFTQRSAVQPLSSVQSASVAHSAVPGVGVATTPGTHAQLPSATMSQWPSPMMAGQAPPFGQGGMKVHEPPHDDALPHCGTGVAGGVGTSATQSHCPFDVTSHCPSRTRTNDPLQILPGGQGT
jgi:hypothetical protein